ncbi:unnamed protein product [Rotaria sordida]|nr:unnamed protein product [Rotaria sordida]CAF3928954.1 unnamed protein product [Rotaria sordida]CAF4147030.1 unnamed protein product [Rotaria sordida]
MRTGSQPSSVAINDFNNDQIPDLAVSNYGTQTVSILLGRGNGGAEVGVTRKFGIELFSFNFDSDDGRSRFMIGGGELNLTLVVNSGIDTITMH